MVIVASAKIVRRGRVCIFRLAFAVELEGCLRGGAPVFCFGGLV